MDGEDWMRLAVYFSSLLTGSQGKGCAVSFQSEITAANGFEIEVFMDVVVRATYPELAKGSFAPESISTDSSCGKTYC